MYKQPHILTFQESALAAEHHSLVYRYLLENDLSEEEFYDVIIFGYLSGVQEYLAFQHKRPLQDILWQAMDRSCCAYQRTRGQDRGIYRFQDCSNGYDSLEEIIADTCNTAEEAIRAIDLENTFRSFNIAEKRIAMLLMNGYPKTEVARMLGISLQTLTEHLEDIRHKIYDSPLMMAA